MLRYVYNYMGGTETSEANIVVSQNEYAQILAKRVNEEKTKKSELRSKSLPPFLISSVQ